jgi:hypothetical protein
MPSSFQPEFNPIAKTLIIVGSFLILVGLIWQFAGKAFPLGRLPGDIAVEKGNFKFYFPIVTCILLSLILSFIGYLIRYFRGN